MATSTAAVGPIVRERVHVIVDEKAPPPPQVFTKQEIVTIDVDSFREAFEWAFRERVKQYPSQADALRSFRQLVFQHLAAKGKLPEELARA